LQKNTVRQSKFLSEFNFVNNIQTLTHFELNGNIIGPKGAQYLGQALSHNTVGFI